MGRLDFDDLPGEREYSGSGADNQSTLTNVMFTDALVPRLSETGVTANAVHPGLVSTRFGVEDPVRAQRLLVPLLRPFMKPPAKGAVTSIYVATTFERGGVRLLLHQ
ncbi:hypothetical protein [Cryobacterium sp. Hh38]|uniref:hypothetical protein n=1 Tax=Cryobacterium sp. Hh38 TaxID=1259156 RepID=UPI00141BA506|nr:hypothetical protein [Cryobacterium sp. Hh38]